MKNLSRRKILSGGAAVSVAAVLGTLNADLMAKDKMPEGYKNQHPAFFNITDDKNYPHFIEGDNLEIDTSINEFQGPGWYLWGGNVYRVERSPGFHDLCGYQVRGAMWEFDSDMFSPSGRAICSHRKMSYVNY